MKTNTDPRAAGSRDAQGLWKYIRSFTKSVDELAEHEMAKGESVPSVSRDGWHEPYRTDHIDAGKPTGATGGEAVELAGRHRDESEQLGGSAAAEELSRRLERMEKTMKALISALGKSVGYDVDPEAFDDEDEDEENEEGETSKGMPSTDIAGLMNAVAGRRDGRGIRVPPSFAKAKVNVFDEIARQIDELPLAKGLAASTLLNQARCVAEGSLPEQVFAHWLSEAEPEIRNMFSQFDRDPTVRKWVF